MVDSISEKLCSPLVRSILGINTNTIIERWRRKEISPFLRKTCESEHSSSALQSSRRRPALRTPARSCWKQKIEG